MALGRGAGSGGNQLCLFYTHYLAYSHSHDTHSHVSKDV